jgi:cyanate permease
VLALTLDDAKTIALVAATALAVGAVVSFWVMKSLVQKLAVAALLGVLAFAVWTQRVSLQDCADKVQDNFELAGTDVVVTDTECSFFGITVTISDPRAAGSSNSD